VLAQLPLLGPLLNHFNTYTRLAILPGAIAFVLYRLSLDGRPSHAAALAWLRMRLEPARLSAFRKLEPPGRVVLGNLLLAPDERPGRVDVRDIGFHSLCAHHFLPFFGTVDVAYEPGDRILGLGKIPRLVDAYARRFQIQEDLVRQVAHAMVEFGKARGVLVRAQARHLCMCSRGPSNPSSVTHTEFALGTMAAA